MSWIVGLMILGFAFLMLEILIPGGIIGAVGGLSILGAIWLSYVEYGVEGALTSFLIGLLGVVACLYVEFKILPKSRAGQRFFLQNSVGGKSQPDTGTADLIGREGRAATVLSPSGYVVVDGVKLEAFSRSGYLDRGDKVRVESFDQFKVIVSKVQ